jgi:hypothetical protein
MSYNKNGIEANLVRQVNSHSSRSYRFYKTTPVTHRFNEKTGSEEP